MNNTSFLADLSRLRMQSPLVYNITNIVAAPFTANALLAIGASPVMSNALEEAKELSNAASALVLNIGTVDAHQLALMVQAGQSMRALGKPIVLDPVGVGASAFRMQAAWQIIDTCHPTIIRGNASEIMALHAQESSFGKGVDTTLTSEQALAYAQALAHRTHAVVVISGAVDYITDGVRTETIEGGSEMQTRVTAMGCAATTLIAAFAAVQPSALQAAWDGMKAMSEAGECAALKAQGTGTMMMHFLDELYQL